MKRVSALRQLKLPRNKPNRRCRSKRWRAAPTNIINHKNLWATRVAKHATHLHDSVRSTFKKRFQIQPHVWVPKTRPISPTQNSDASCVTVLRRPFGACSPRPVLGHANEHPCATTTKRANITCLRRQHRLRTVPAEDIIPSMSATAEGTGRSTSGDRVGSCMFHTMH